MREHPDPVPSEAPRFQTFSWVRVLPFIHSVVPPTAVTCGELAGHWTPYPSSPDATVIATPRWSKWLS